MLVAMLMCLNFSACSDDDDLPDGDSGKYSLVGGVWYCSYKGPEGTVETKTAFYEDGTGWFGECENGNILYKTNITWELISNHLIISMYGESDDWGKINWKNENKIEVTLDGEKATLNRIQE